MPCQVDQIADCGDIMSLARSLFISEKEDTSWLTQCAISLSPCGNLLAVGYKNRLCILTSQWISSTDSNTFLISWSGTLPSDITVLLALSICPSQNSSQNGPDWFCIAVGFKNGSIGFYTNTGHLLLLEKLEDKPVMKISCHTGTYGTLPDDLYILFQNCQCIVTGSSLFQTLRHAKTMLARVQAGLQADYTVDSRNISIRKWMFTEQDTINDAVVVGLELKNTYDHLLAASTYGGYEVWYRSVPPVNTLILGAGSKPYVGFHYALEGGTTPPLQDVARAVANKIKSALPGWLGGASTETASSSSEPIIRSEALTMRCGLVDEQRLGNGATVSPDRRLAAFVDSLGRVAVLDVSKGHLIRLFKGCRDAQCAFVQIFEADDKKPQLSVIKEIRRAIFLIIYNPKKGLIDIRLMQRGNRVAVFTATKNGRLIYNTCGLVGAEKNHSYKKLNLPEFQCVLIDPDGKLKKFNIPFFYALEGEHSERSKDLQNLRELRDYIKKTPNTQAGFGDELIMKAAELKTIELKKHTLEMLVRNYNVPPKIVMSCIHLFWKNLDNESLCPQDEDIKSYFANLYLVSLFYRYINEETVDDAQEITDEILQYLGNDNAKDLPKAEIEPTSDFHLLEDDNCILERLLTLAQESQYKEQQQARVTFADNTSGTYKDFVSCFVLLEKSKYISLQPEITADKLNDLASTIFKSIFKMIDLKMLNVFMKECCIDPKDILKLLIMQLMSTPLEKISLDLIEKFIAVLYFICSVTEEATNIAYNEISPWWEHIRNALVEMYCPLRSMIVAMACKAVGRIFESSSIDREEEIWESVTKENAKWGILIGKLEDISILSIVLMFKDNFIGNSLPKLPVAEYNINLKYIYTRGKGSVTELIAKWLCGMGVVPEAIIANELLETYTDEQTESSDPNVIDEPAYIFTQNNRIYVDKNPQIFKWISLLRRQFPLSTSSDYIIANMCWEYAIAWQKNIKNMELLQTVNLCLMNVSDIHIRLGLFSIVWSTYIKHIFEVNCRLVNKVGKMPKDALCIQDLGFDNGCMLNFLQIVTTYLDNYILTTLMPSSKEKHPIQYEKIWDDSMPSLVEVAQHNKNVNDSTLSINHQIACTIFYQTHFNLKFTKPLDSLFDVDYQYVLEALAGNVTSRELNMIASDKVRNPRMKFLTKLIRAAVETISCSDNSGPDQMYDSYECAMWMERIISLAEKWGIENDFIRRQQCVALFHLGYDTLLDNIILLIETPETILPPLLAISIQRLKRSLEHSSNQAEWIVSVPPQLYKHLQNTVLDTSIPAHPSLATTISVLQKVLVQVEKKVKDTSPHIQSIKLAKLIIENCEVLIRRKL